MYLFHLIYFVTATPLNVITSNAISSETFFGVFMNLSGILLQIKSPVVIAVFLIALFEEVFVEFLVDYLAVSRNI